MRDACPHLLKGGGAVGLAEHLPGLRCPQRGEAAVEAAADDTVMRGMRFEEKRFAWRESTKLTAPARPPEVDLRLGDFGTVGEKPVPLVIRHPHITRMPALCTYGKRTRVISAASCSPVTANAAQMIGIDLSSVAASLRKVR